MLRSGAPRAALRALNCSPLTPRASFQHVKSASAYETRLHTLVNGRASALTKALATPTSRFYTRTQVLQDKIDTKHEKDFGKKKISAHPELVSAGSSSHPVFGEVGAQEQPDDTDMMAGIRSDLHTIKETFSLADVPRKAQIVGLAGTLPYLATSLSTVFCAYEINHAADHGSGILLSGRTAEALLHVIEPIQVGWGAVIISFMGAIHWGFEWAKYGGVSSDRRYLIGLIAPAIAWPSILLPVESALIAQFLAFNFLYYWDSRSTKRGLAPPWYSVYRFVLTFIVGASLVITLIGRGQIADQIGRLPGPADRIMALRAAQAGELEKEEEARRKKTAEDEEEEEADDEE